MSARKAPSKVSAKKAPAKRAGRIAKARAWVRRHPRLQGAAAGVGVYAYALHSATINPQAIHLYHQAVALGTVFAA